MTELQDLRRVDAADVYKADRLAGTLRRRPDGQVEFAYAGDYLADRAAPAIAWTLPRRSEPFVAGSGAVPPFFAGLLPEGTRLMAVVAATRTSADDHLTLLLGVGQDAIGDVGVVPAGADWPPVTEPVDESAIARERLADVFARAIATEPSTFERVALPGVQPKVSAAMISAPLRTTLGPAILKLNPPTGYPRLVQNEAFFLDMAGDCGLPAPEHRLVKDAVGAFGLLLARFDRVTDGQQTIRLPQEDGCQLLGRYPADKYRLKTEDVITVAAEVVEAGDGSRALALRRLMELVAFSYLIGNGDLHGKNFSVRRTSAGLWEVAPAYDLLSTQPYTGWRDPMALDLYGRANKVDRRHLREAGNRLGLSERALDRVLDSLCEAAGPWIDRVPEIGLDDRSTELLQSMMRARLAELMG